MPVRIEEHIWIPLSDGCRLGARLWLPATAPRVRVPAILEYIPYRKRDGTRARDDPMHGYFAEHGYAAVRVDMRGSGESDGHLADEYLRREQDDALEVIAWIARQPWCTGAVGMQGKSWGGFNALQVAARRPPALKAIITTFSTDNRYTDDIHYMGGCVLNDNLWWGSIMLAYQSRPLDPVIVGAGWRARWLERIENLPFFPALWLARQRYDEYWKHGSVCEDFAAIGCPVLAIGGWTDAYTNAVPRLLAGLKVPRLGIIGPWGHVYPHDGVPGPAIGYLQEAVRWWDQWLKGRDTGIMKEPMLRAYIEDPVPPEGTRTFTPGRWVGERSFPSPDVAPQRLHLRADRSLGEEGGASTDFAIRSPQSHGKAAGEWMGVGCPGEQPTDQRLDDGGALVFETAPLAGGFDVLGAPVLRLRVAADTPVAQLAVRLSDVAPDERVTRVSYQLLNLTHRDSHEHPSALEPGRYYDVAVRLNACGHRFLSGPSRPAFDCVRLLADRLARALRGDAVGAHGRQRPRSAGAPGRRAGCGLLRAAGTRAVHSRDRGCPRGSPALLRSGSCERRDDLRDRRHRRGVRRGDPPLRCSGRTARPQPQARAHDQGRRSAVGALCTDAVL